jgi:hypothetical protein
MHRILMHRILMHRILMHRILMRRILMRRILPHKPNHSLRNRRPLKFQQQRSRAPLEDRRRLLLQGQPPWMRSCSNTFPKN